ncbi:hypothetical protein HD806DRAFT_261673 [Xylariaceae sp. AK1471]|nr:hypothetical protein HD806DRAFT_261673 [Xylariaceae sp. AK1471]
MAIFSCRLAYGTNANDPGRVFYMMIDYEYDNRSPRFGFSHSSSLGQRRGWKPRCSFAQRVPSDGDLNVETLCALDWTHTLDHFDTSISANEGPIHLRGDIFVFFISLHTERFRCPQTTLFRLIELNRLRDGQRIKHLIRRLLSSSPPFWFLITGWSLLFLAAYGIIAGVAPLTVLGIVYGTINLEQGFSARHRRLALVSIRLLRAVDILLPVFFFLVFFWY